MLAYAVIMYTMAVVMVVLGLMVYRGKTQLIHEYHQRRVKDKTGYAKAMGKVLMGISAPLFCAGTVGLFTESILPTVVLLVGLMLSFIPFFYVQKKYNGGVF